MAACPQTSRQGRRRIDAIDPIPPELRAAYRATRYFVEASPEGAFTLRVDEPSAAADRLCERLGQRSWAFVTAGNPRSRPLPPQQNEARMRELLILLDAQELRYFFGAGIGDDPGWPPERSVFIAGAGREYALALGARFGQYAVLYGEAGAPARLLPCALFGPAPSPRSA